MKKKILIIALAVIVAFSQSSSYLYAQTAPTAPTAPSVPDTPESPPPAPDSEAPPDEVPISPEMPDAPTLDEVINPTEEEAPVEEPPVEEEQPVPPATESTQPEASDSEASTTSEENQTTDEQTNTESTGDEKVLGDGDPYIETGDATSTAIITNDVNSNESVTSEDDSVGIKVLNDSNASDSENTGSVTIVDSDMTIQDNTATIVNDLDQTSNSGNNTASENVGDATIDTGDANVTGTIINSVNTNVDGIAVVEFNVIDDHIGDIILDFSEGCVTGCNSDDLLAANVGNGSESENTSEINLIDDDITFQTNDAEVENNMTLLANSGDNKTNDNTASDTSIETGDANVAANILNFVNNNIAGDVIYSVVNVFGDLIGDIMFDEDTFSSSEVTAANTENLSGSENTTTIDQITADEIYQFNTVDIENNLVFDANTGENAITDNTQGSTSIETGDVDIDAQVINVANTNITDGNWWLVIVNEAGNWIGKIIGDTDGDGLAGSEGFEFVVDENGQITAVNSGNGTDTTNIASISTQDTNTNVQTNDASIVNNVNLTANTGGNKAIGNTGGDNSIETGDASIVANIVNFVNTNIVGPGRLFVTVVNVFGNWMGDFITPGSEKEEVALGGVGDEQTTAQSSNSNSNDMQSSSEGGSGGSSSSSDNGSSDGPSDPFSTPVPIVMAASYEVARGNAEGKISDLGGQVAFAGETSDPNDPTKQVEINLAWLILMIPAYFGFRSRRRLFNLLTLWKRG